MMGKRRLSRELSLKVLFQVDIAHSNLQDALQYIFSENNYSDDVKNFCLELVKNVEENILTIDKTIREFAENWSLERIANIDRNILRIAICEILFLEDIPKSVSINEAVELSKKYGTKSSFSFVNGVLGKINKRDIKDNK
ncbi:MAG: transcription antitermination factor NusB [Candidatus Caldatribacteriota bacterium]|nr:transcription antitermination factor NusB [Candidatus Caldatribacteriota bacterium]